MASVPISAGLLAPVKNRRGSFDKVVDQNSPYFFKTAPFFIPPLFFTSPYFSLGKLHLNKTFLPYFFYFFRYFSLGNLHPTQNVIFIFYFLVIFHWANYTLNKTFFREGKEAENGGENLSQKLGRGTSAQKLGGKLHPILIPDLGE